MDSIDDLPPDATKEKESQSPAADSPHLAEPATPLTPGPDTKNVAEQVQAVLQSELAQMYPVHAPSQRRTQLTPEHAERIRSLRFGEIIIHKDLPPDEALREMEQIYSSNLVPDDAFYYLASGEEGRFLDVVQDGMLNRFHPLDAEKPHYPPGHVSVRDQIYRDMCEPEKCAGDYRVFGLRDPEGILRCWGSFRLPSADPERQKRYKEYLDATLFNSDLVKLEGNIRTILDKANYQLIEFDTENGCDGWEYAGTMLLYRTLRHLRAERGAQMPKGLFFYRFVGLEPISPLPPGTEEDFSVSLGSNATTANMVRNWGCADIGYRHDPHERVVRVVDNFSTVKSTIVPVVACPKWRYSSGKISIVEERCQDRLIQRGLIAEEE